MNKSNWLLSLLAVSALCGSSIVYAKINSADIVQQSISLSCIDWKPVGVCFWLKCTLFGCNVQTSVKVRHFNPDAVVQVYQNPNEVPWEEMSFVSHVTDLGQTATTPSMAREVPLAQTNNERANKSAVPRQNAKIISRHVAIIGSPGIISVAKMLDATEYGCDSGVTPYMPYYVSTLDYFSWRWPYADYLYPSVFVPGMREVGERKDGQNETFLFSGKFGNVYPRIGSLLQGDSYKASAVFAQRAADIVTDQSALHVYQFLGEKRSKSGWWPPGQVKEWTSKEGKWQMLSPTPEDKCHIFGEPSTRKDGSGFDAAYDGYQHRRSKNGDYAWQLWRPYSCCKKKGQVFLYSIDVVKP
ncbi:TIGR03756 family integrating conjugative element protein [Shewanella xiamenensis]|uniref:TIGR03756 family integrating conjugative element protein n=1 Tax=Shewanella xiamenensis TaxID=332186 RepID=UPI0021BF9507|nr:TIGR03756 family integrating conjugative element protein [Shewanella xiamenensis]MCT8873754.1 TIGR03756 family integrating conjugative element protein [Shewanella xiamenensis]